jgi:hypothetical protein
VLQPIQHTYPQNFIAGNQIHLSFLLSRPHTTYVYLLELQNESIFHDHIQRYLYDLWEDIICITHSKPHDAVQSILEKLNKQLEVYLQCDVSHPQHIFRSIILQCKNYLMQDLRFSQHWKFKSWSSRLWQLPSSPWSRSSMVLQNTVILQHYMKYLGFLYTSGYFILVHTSVNCGLCAWIKQEASLIEMGFYFNPFFAFPI